jgi:hypothetical protein
MCEDVHARAHGIHSFSTSTIFVQQRARPRIFAGFHAQKFFARETLHNLAAIQPEDNSSF